MTRYDEILRLDALYEPFPAFNHWSRPLQVPIPSELVAKLIAKEDGSEAEARDFSSGIAVAVRAAAFETGAIEKLYSTDRGLTISVALQSVAWDQQVTQRSKNARKLFDSQLEAYELLVDNVSGNSPLSEAFLRRMHEVICANQETYDVETPQGVQEQALPKGIYKIHPNHLAEDRHQKPFAFAPVGRVTDEIQRLISECRRPEFVSADPVLQAAWAHYALVRVHPFADGNGRVARALASAFLMKAYRVPLLIFSDQRDEYLQALESADGDRPDSLVNLFSRCTIASLELATESMNLRPKRDSSKSIEALAKLYKTAQGLTHQEVDLAAYRLADELIGQLNALLKVHLCS